MAKYNFSLFGNCMSFQTHIRRHIMSENFDRIKDYLCAAYDTYKPSKETYKDHPCFEFIEEGMNLLKKNGWKFKIIDWEDKGKQFVCISPEGKYYRSHYEYKQKEKEL